MAADRDDQLLGEMSRRNWIILAALILVSLLWRSLPVTLGVLAGGLLAILAYYWRYLALSRLLGAPSRQSAKGFQFSYVVRLVVLGGALFLLIAKARVDVIALVVGLSVVVLNVLITTIKRSI
ncbi:ATP synthase subunit I [Trichloromonas sp.]|uniref:ATP synthase subunit I n=1 Tax=Trichloromonas sp. TaxID=3069249 RepID=UPI003D8144C1